MRHINFKPDIIYFKPRGVSLADLEHVLLNLEEVESLRLSDLQGESQKTAAEKMKISQSTYHRVLKEARQKVADALINGKSIELKGGDYIMPGQDGTGPAGRAGGRVGRGGGRGRGRAGLGGPRMCKCPSCGKQVPHTPGIPCVSMKCPECDSIMVRGDL